ncbi:MAG TPA: TonB-dependent receptor [Polyangiaceae bacterium]|nr:TonB-dependent receptor [Polyangiaceae bacterium]
MLTCLRLATVAGVAALLTALPARAQDPSSPAPSASNSIGHDATDRDSAVTPPSLKSRPDAVYPPDALRDRLEGSVGLEITVDESGAVADVRVTQPAGHGFDEAAIAAVRQWTFEPAKKNGQPVRATVDLALPFQLPALPDAGVQAAAGSASAASPPAALPPAPAATAPGRTATPTAPAIAPPEIAQAGASTLVLGRRPLSAASSLAVRDRDFSLRPVDSVQDILRVTPGLVMVQHSGGGKANQYFLRGFDADHGTDIALSVDGIPINMVSHAHGQGYSDTNFIIPEAIERVEITKGPYFANQGDFATAGAVNLVTRDEFEHSSLGFGAGDSPGHGEPSYRGLLVASPKFESTKAFFAAEIGRQNGPFDNPEGWDRYKLFSKVTLALTPTSSFTLGESSYSGNWNGSGQIPERAVDEGLVSRFGSLDPYEGGNTARHQLFVSYKLRPTESSELQALAYLGAYRFDLFSNFTLYLEDPVNGDEIQQIDRRTFYGGKASYRIVHELGGVKFDTTMGADVRGDDIHEELWHTAERVEIEQIRGNDVHETMLGAYVNEEVTPFKSLRLDAGGRADMLSFAVDNTLVTTDPTNPRSGIGDAHQFSPKASAVLTPVDRKDAQLDVYANWGNGFHSNDVRGVFTTPSVTPLTRAIGEEIGGRTRLFERWDFAATGWLLDLDNETTWDGDNGTTAVSPATRRYGVELETRYEFTPWLAADANVTFTHSQFSTDHENGNGLALAPKQTWDGGLSARHPLGPGVARAGVRVYGIGDRPASDDGVIVAPGFTQVDLHLGYRTRRFDLALDISNLLDGSFRSAQFDTVSRLRTDPAIGSAGVPTAFCGANGRLAAPPAGQPAVNSRGQNIFYGCEGVDFTPAYPLTARVMATLFLD